MLQSGTESGTASHQICGTIKAGPDYTVGATGDLTLTAGHRVALVDGFSVAAGGRLTAGTDPSLDPGGQPHDATQRYAFDPYGNLLSITTDEEGQSPVTRTFSTSFSTNRLTQASYDSAGNMTAWGGWEYRWDPFAMMNQAKPTGGNGFTFVYGPGDERIWTIDWTRGTAGSNWLETWTLRDLGGTPLRQFQLDGGNTPTGNWTLHRDYVRRGGSLLAAHTPEGLRHFHLDHLGTPRIVTDAAAKTVSEHFYYPFGEEASDASQNAEVMKFTGHERDDLDGGGSTFDLDYMHARFCSPHTGRFLSVDPANRYKASTAPQGYNRYAYVEDNPLSYVDPDGELRVRAIDTGIQHLGTIYRYEVVFESPLTLYNEKASGFMGQLGKLFKRSRGAGDFVKDRLEANDVGTSDSLRERVKHSLFEGDLQESFEERRGQSVLAKGTFDLYDMKVLEAAAGDLIEQIEKEDPARAKELREKYDIEDLREKAEREAKRAKEKKLQPE